MSELAISCGKSRSLRERFPAYVAPAHRGLEEGMTPTDRFCGMHRALQSIVMLLEPQREVVEGHLAGGLP
jgi:hypothetical protein